MGIFQKADVFFLDWPEIGFNTGVIRPRGNLSVWWFRLAEVFCDFDRFAGARFWWWGYWRASGQEGYLSREGEVWPELHRVEGMLCWSSRGCQRCAYLAVRVG